MELESTREVEEGKGEEEEEEGEKGEWEAGEEGCSPSPGELEGGQPEERLQGGYKRQDRDAGGPTAPTQPLGDPPRSLAASAEDFSPRRQKSPAGAGTVPAMPRGAGHRGS